jgi:hypothetical protein
VQDGEDRRIIREHRVGVPGCRPFDTIPIHLAIFLDVGKPGHFRIFRMTVLDQRMYAWRAEPAAERGEFGRAEILVAEHKHRMSANARPIQAKVT